MVTPEELAKTLSAQLPTGNTISDEQIEYWAEVYFHLGDQRKSFLSTAAMMTTKGFHVFSLRRFS